VQVVAVAVSAFAAEVAEASEAADWRGAACAAPVEQAEAVAPPSPVRAFVPRTFRWLKRNWSPPAGFEEMHDGSF
jgi:hypothetical protein